MAKRPKHLSQAGQILQAALIQRAKKKQKMPRFPQPKAAKQLERDYARKLRPILAKLESICEARLINRLPALTASFYQSHPSLSRAKADSEMQFKSNLDAINQQLISNFDADEDQEISKIIGDIRVELGQDYTPEEIRRIARQQGVSIADYNERVIIEGLKRVVGVDLFFAEPWLETQLAAFTELNVDLITGLTDYALDQVKKEVIGGLMGGLRWEEVADNIRDLIDPKDSTASSRADFIARDQTSKLNGQLTGLRQSDLGIEKFIWRTSQDERVRDSHRIKEGNVYEWAAPPADTGAPGEDYNCRCTAEPYLEPMPGLGESFASTGLEAGSGEDEQSYAQNFGANADT